MKTVSERHAGGGVASFSDFSFDAHGSDRAEIVVSDKDMIDLTAQKKLRSKVHLSMTKSDFT